MGEYDVGFKTGFIEALDEYNRRIARQYCDLRCPTCEGVCPFDVIKEEIINDENNRRRTITL